MKIALISEDRLLLQQMRAILGDGDDELMTMPSQAPDLRNIVKESAPDLMLVDGRNKEALDLEHVERLTLQYPAVAVVLISDAASPKFLLAAMRAGVREVISPSHLQELLRAAVERIAAKLTAAQASDHAKIHAFIATSGGSGATFLVTNFGYQLAQSHKVLLVDLNLQFGDALSFIQDGKASKSIGDIARDIKRLDSSLLNASTIHVTPNYHILAAPEEPGQASDIRPEHIDAILGLAVTQYDIVLLDMPRIVDAMLMTALDRAASIFLVLQASVPHLRNADKLLSAFRSLDYSREKVALILNRYDKRNDITIDKIHKALGQLEIHTIANGYRQVSTAINQGVPLMQLERKHGVIRSLNQLGDTMAPAAEHPASLFERLFKRA
ncbi:CpaE family protein [Massilia sp. LXY-6]|uniref:AAA family ATPase n=1 Tax=Massilia sp. LXY-6 TaxID=3379823 RepID=UPI003EE313C0